MRIVSVSNVNPSGVGRYVANYYGLIGPYKCPDSFSVAISAAQAVELRRQGVPFE